ncbi:MAG TPA: triose-phosphate isomerase [Candidatus Baltobacteraceae bacterium]|nr:triose-phosphate isomerase [Candidatus Baltobacteraceae bacterium]
MPVSARARVCAGNWKMYKTASEARAFFEAFLPLAQGIPDAVDLIVCPPFTALQAARDILASQTRVKLGAQNMHWEPQGAFTGEISAGMLTDLGVTHVILGHSERRQYFGETDENVRRKTFAALEAGLTPIVAVGETLDIRDRGEHVAHTVSQTKAAFAGLEAQDVARCIVAYEPVWAIGTGKNCDANDANEMMRAIRGCVAGLQNVPILYGGSVKPDNIALYAAQSDIDGGLVGGASLDPAGFANLASQLANAS